MTVRLRQTESPTCRVLDLGRLSILFSYETPVAYYTASEGWVARTNVWGPTTGKHINAWVPETSGRITGEEFERRLASALTLVGAH